MTAVFVSPESEKDDIKSLFNLLNENHIVSVADKNYTNISENSDFLLMPLQGKRISTSCNCAAVMFSACRSAEFLPEDCAVLCFDDKSAICCSGKRRQIISCGMHNKDTVTLSSMESGKPVLSVQRRLAAFSGDIIDVGDFPLITDEKNQCALIAAAVLLLLCGKPLSPLVFCHQSSTTVPPTLSKYPL